MSNEKNQGVFISIELFDRVSAILSDIPAKVSYGVLKEFEAIVSSHKAKFAEDGKKIADESRSAPQ